MKLLTVAAIFLFAQQGTAPAPKATIEGTVLRAGSGEPLAGAQITMVRAAGPTGAQLLATGLPPAVTDRQGQFQLKNIDPGTYRMYATRNGYARQEYAQKSLSGLGSVLTITPGQSLKNVVFRLTPAATVTGRISSPDGEPMTGTTVLLLRVAYDSTGKRTQRPVSAVRTDDRGEYRLYWITPGQYYVAVTPGRSTLDSQLAEVASIAFQYANQPGPARSDAREVFEAAALLNHNEVVPLKEYSTTYYPNSTDVNRAVLLDIKPGNEIGGININPVRQPLARIRGRLVDAAGQPQIGSVRLVFSDGEEVATVFSGSPAIGEFEFANVIPGTYYVRALLFAPAGARGARGANPAANPAAAQGPIADARAQVTVSGVDVDNVTLTLRPGISINGRVRADGLASITDLQGFERMNVVLAAADDLTTQPQPARFNADGTFTAANVFPGTYRIRIDGRPTDVFMKSITFGSTDLMRDAFVVSDSVQGTLDVVVSSHAGQLEGNLFDKAQKPVPGAQVTIVPTLYRARRELYRTAITDTNGHFTIASVTPGDYKAFAWDELEPFSYFDADFIRKFENEGKPFTLAESGKATVDVRIIPSAGN
jgi:protocatechuate 3,4-dioxygenase beta subunit